MEKRTAGLIATIAAVLLCGCPGLLFAFTGAIFAAVSFVPDAEIDIFGSSEPRVALATGAAACCVGVIFVLIPIVVGFITLRRKQELQAPPIDNQPLPPPM